jgi:DNA-binding transcriptional MocR family regulator
MGYQRRLDLLEVAKKLDLMILEDGMWRQVILFFKVKV